MSEEKWGGLASSIGVGVALGAGLGVALGALLFDNVALGIGPGVAIGIPLAYAYDLYRRDKRKMDDKK